MGPSVKKVQPGSQATPLAQDVLKQLQGQISEGAFGQGVGPLQRSAGTAIQQYLTSLNQRATPNYTPTTVNTASQLTNDTGQLISALQTQAGINTNRSAADLREAYGIGGTRFGTPLALGEARLRSDAGNALNTQIGQILVDQAAREQAARQFDVGANIGEKQFGAGLDFTRQNALDQNVLAGITQLFNQGQANIAPFLQLAQLGILPQEILASPGVGSQLLSAATQFGANYLGGGGSLPIGGGGGGPVTTTNFPAFQPPSFYPTPGQPSGIGMSGGINPNAPSIFQLDPRLLGG